MEKHQPEYPPGYLTAAIKYHMMEFGPTPETVDGIRRILQMARESVQDPQDDIE
jgi:hypothetical protein